MNKTTKTEQISQLMTLAENRYNIALGYSNMPFMARKNSTSDRYQRQANENMTEALFIIFRSVV